MKRARLSATNLEAICRQTATILQNGGLVVYPTDTVYGIAANATSQAAVDKLRAFKGQRGNKAISIAVRNQTMAEKYVMLNDTAKNLYSTFLPGPLTIISKLETRNSKLLAKGIASLDGAVGIRIIPHDFVTKLFNHINFPITATSANISNAPNPRSLEQWLKQTPEKKQSLVDLFIDIGELPYAKPSTVIDTSKENTDIVRQGSVVIPAETGIYAKTYTSTSPDQTKKIAQTFTAFLQHPASSIQHRATLVALQGPLGAGKTVFTQGIAEALGIKEPLRSPTYTLVKEYSLPRTLNPKLQALNSEPRTPHSEPKTLFHIDAWRLHSEEEFDDLRLESMLQPGNIIVLEWPQRLSSIINQLRSKMFIVLIDIKVKNDTHRGIRITRLS